MAKKKTTKKNTAKTSAKSTSKTSAKSTSKTSAKSTSKTSAKSSSRTSSKSTSSKRKYTPKKKTEDLGVQQSWDLEQKIEAAPAPADDGTKEISIEDYQPVIWIQPEAEAAPEEKPDEPTVPAAESYETPAIEKYEEPAAKPYETPAIEKYEEPAAEPYETPAIEKYEEPAAEAVRSSKREGGFDAVSAVSAKALNAARIAGAAFFGVLVLMFVLNIVTEDVLYSDQENRVFQQLPKFSVGNYLSGRFESQLDNYVSDQFAFRNTFIKIKSSADLTVGQIKANGVIKAKDSYLMEDIVYPDRSSFYADLNALKQFRKKYKKKKMYFMLVPNAANILSDKLPGGVVTHDQNKDIDRLFRAVKKMGYKTVDVREELTEASKKQQVYYRTDHHWTTDGAYAAYRKAAEVMKLKSETEYETYTVKKDFVGTLCSKSGFTNGRKDAIKIYLPAGDKYLNSVIRYKDKKEKTTMYYDMANLDIKDAYTVFGGTNQSLITISTPTKKNRHLLVVKDSYANCFIPFLTQDYRTITIVDPRYYYENIATVIKADEIDDVLFLYNANTFFSDNYMRMMLTNK